MRAQDGEEDAGKKKKGEKEEDKMKWSRDLKEIPRDRFERWKDVSVKIGKERRVAAKHRGWEQKKPGAGLGFGG